ncbi:hypothetical protein BV20DRAFT_971342 [Pilatotrama ljubarskyi]|nr:hypothetical protein BV20DRAFT_971342 [Pilatotrama ljubarskyi]
MSDNQAVHAEPEARVSGGGQGEEPDPKSGVTAAESASASEPASVKPAVPTPTTAQPSSAGKEENDDDDFFIPRGQSVQTAAAGSKKGGRPR